MGFWHGLIIGVFASTNIGILVAGLMAGTKRQEDRVDYPWENAAVDHAVMDRTQDETQPVIRPARGAIADTNNPC